MGFSLHNEIRVFILPHHKYYLVVLQNIKNKQTMILKKKFRKFLKPLYSFDYSYNFTHTPIFMEGFPNGGTSLATMARRRDLIIF